jgi:NAD(P)-dependent dehydrogenase (short-subunit alcohol dehydrogenase family)
VEKKSNLMEGKLCIITGATSGIGEATARALADMGGRIVIISRNQTRCIATVERIKNVTGNSAIEYFVADLSSQKDIYNVAQEINDRYDSINVLVNNAGNIFYKRRESVDGIEMTFALNHLAYFLLTTLLLDKIRKCIHIQGVPARIINVSSRAHVNTGMNFDDLEGGISYDGWRAYGQSKLANVLFTYELARRLRGTGVMVNALHPGYVATGIGAKDNGLWGKILGSMTQRTGSMSPEEGAETSIYLASSPEVQGVTGKYFAAKQAVPSSSESYDEEKAERLWQVSLNMIHVPLTI